MDSQVKARLCVCDRVSSQPVACDRASWQVSRDTKPNQHHGMQAHITAMVPVERTLSGCFRGSTSHRLDLTDIQAAASMLSS